MGQYQANLAPKEQKTLIGLIRKQNIVKLYINDRPVDILWHTGANVSTISKEYVNNFFPNVVIKNLHGILSDAEKLQVRCGNQVILPYEGYVELEVSLDNDTPANEILVPFLITPEILHYPILQTLHYTDTNEHISQNYQSNELADVLNKCLPDKSKNVIDSIVKLHPCRETARIIKHKDTKNIMSLNQLENKSVLNVTWIE